MNRLSTRRRVAGSLALITGLVLGGGAGSSPARSQDKPRAPSTLKSGDSGPAVEALQRALNARLDPPPGLTVDGDFGNATRDAVSRFQRSKGLDATGQADPKTVEALGPPPTPGEDPPVPSPDVVNVLPPLKGPADRLDGPPFVSAKAWVVLDGRTGEVVAGHDEATPLDMASTTKIMTALVVLRQAKADPGLLDERVTFSERADKTTGSTSGVRAGESLPLRELLYGLLLPSGNDASVALAEHVGARLKSPAGGPELSDPFERFVAEMNRASGELGFKESHFVNTHGLTAPGHRSSARDLARMAREGLADPVFADCVGTARRGGTLAAVDGTTRNVIWTNTNQLLKTEGYDGVKTGTTNAAGMCLVASGRRGDDHLIVVLLGGDSSAARYADARNLFRWGWLTRGHVAP